MNKQTAVHHVADATNSMQNYTCIDDPSTNGDPNAMLFITRNFALNTPYITVPMGVFYSGTALKPNNQWCIYREDNNAIPASTTFNVLVIKQ
jgi:hypothetical protein